LVGRHINAQFLTALHDQRKSCAFCTDLGSQIDACTLLGYRLVPILGSACGTRWKYGA
jgi:hypothetical protein